MQWKDEFKIGIPIIDTQHKQLFLCENELSAALTKGLRPAAIDNFLTQLGFYVTRHFSMEEHYMEQSSYPGLSEQLEAHRSFALRFTEIQEEFIQTGLNPSVVHAIQNELSAWLKNHVLGLDLTFGAYYQEKKREKNTQP
ncbi:MAG: bacteriohemerythrin [Proteobacteria bacterium]|nr:bacteriohemerythrin [Pseudomonadota bacterium]MBU1650314.1 bacteriohemerythrin [Pseudomonadota bacterium]MBU1986302.1 bacteriohemerythrin [Pseudomonadota bacterium]